MANTNRRRGTRFERELANWLQASRVPLSGAGALKGDVMVPLYSGAFLLIEAKSTVSSFYRLNDTVLEKLIINRVAMRTYGVCGAMLAVRFARYTEPLLLISDDDVSLLRETITIPFPIPDTTYIQDVTFPLTVRKESVNPVVPIRFVSSGRKPLPNVFLDRPARATWYYVAPTTLADWVLKVRDMYGYWPTPRRGGARQVRTTTSPAERLLRDLEQGER